MDFSNSSNCQIYSRAAAIASLCTCQVQTAQLHLYLVLRNAHHAWAEIKVFAIETKLKASL